MYLYITNKSINNKLTVKKKNKEKKYRKNKK